MDFTQFCASGTKYSHQYISGDKDIKLFLIHFKPKIKSNFSTSHFYFWLGFNY